MAELSPETSCKEVLPLIASLFEPANDDEMSILDPYSYRDPDEEIPDYNQEAIYQAASDSGYIKYYEAGEQHKWLRDELSELSWLVIQEVDQKILKRASDGEPGLLCAIAMAIAAESNRQTIWHNKKTLMDDAYSLLGEASLAGEPRANWILGERFSRMKNGLEESIRLLSLAAASGHKPAKLRLEQLYERRYILKDEVAERRWLELFADAGVIEAKYEAANAFYLCGELKRAFKWMLEAAEFGHQAARGRVAFFFEVGQGCAKNIELANHWRKSPNREMEEVYVAETSSAAAEEFSALKMPYEGAPDPHLDVDESPDEIGWIHPSTHSGSDNSSLLIQEEESAAVENSESLSERDYSYINEEDDNATVNEEAPHIIENRPSGKLRRALNTIFRIITFRKSR